MPEKRANIVVYKKKNILLQHKKILFLLVIILIALPVTVILVLNRQNFLNYADSGAIIQKIEVSPGKISIDVKSTEPVYLSALAYDSFGKPVKYLAVNYEWSMSSIDSVGTITNTYGEITEFRPLKYGCGELTVTARWGQEALTKAIQVSVSDREDKPNCTGIPTLTPTPTLEPDPTTLNLESIKLHGLGKGGDNTNANLSGNLKPLRTVREISLELENSEGTALPILAGEISYSSSSGYFSGSVVLSNEIPSGSYIVKVKSPQFLKRQVTGIVVITENKTSNISGLSLVAGDVDDDNSVDIDDYNLLIDCYSDILPARNCDDEAKKTAADLSDDGYVNSDDYNLFLRELSVLSGD
jgi:hypothetical protein